MKSFTVETPVLRLSHSKFYYRYRGDYIVCRNGLAKLFQIEQPRRISFLLSSKYSRAAKKFTVTVMAWSDDVYFFDCDKFYEPTELASSIDDRWLCKHTPLGDLKPGESATVYVTLYVHED